MTGSKETDPNEVAAVEEAIQFLDEILSKTDFVAGNELTIADFSIVASFSTISLVLAFPEAKYPNVQKWFKNMQQLPYYQKANQEGLDALEKVMQEICAGELKLKSRSQETE